MDFDDLIALLRAAAESTRLRILMLLGCGELSVGEVTHVLGQSQPRVSRHLKVLVDVGLVDRFPEGAQVFYRLADNVTMQSLRDFLNQALCANEITLQRDLEQLESIRLRRFERVQRLFADAAEGWDELGPQGIDGARVFSVMRAMLQSLPVAQPRLVDIGTGSGQVLEALAECVQTAVGIDINQAMLSVARSRLSHPDYAHLSLRHGDLYRLPYAAAEFSVAILHLVLHFVDDPRSALIEAARVVGADGWVIVADFPPHSQELLRERFEHRWLGFSEVQLKSFTDAAHLQIMRSKTVSGDALAVRVWLCRGASKGTC